MTDASTSTPEADVAYLKRLAQAGRGAPAPFLMLMAVFGGAYGLFALVTGGLVLLEMQDEGMGTVGSTTRFVSQWGFGMANAAFLIGVVWTLWQTFGPRRQAVSRAGTAIWSAAFIGLIATLGAMTTSVLGPHPMLRPEGLPSVLLTLWGCAWWATAIIGERRWLLAVACGSLAAAVFLPVSFGSLWALPMLAACLLMLAFLPAVLLMRERRG